MKLQASERDSGTGVFCEFCKISKNTFLTEHLRATASVSDQDVFRTFDDFFSCATEAAAQMFFKIGALKISQYSQENTCVGV